MDGVATRLRLFVGLWPDDATRRAIASWQQEWTWPQRAAPVRPERLHLTLHFLGAVPRERLPELRRSLHVPFEPFSLVFGHGEVWPNGVAVLRPASPPAALAQLHTALGQPLEALGLTLDERPYRAHVTLARRAIGAIVPPRGPDLRWHVNQGFVLVRSLPGAAGYEIIDRFGG